MFIEEQKFHVGTGAAEVGKTPFNPAFYAAFVADYYRGFYIPGRLWVL